MPSSGRKKDKRRSKGLEISAATASSSSAPATEPATTVKQDQLGDLASPVTKDQRHKRKRTRERTDEEEPSLKRSRGEDKASPGENTPVDTVLRLSSESRSLRRKDKKERKNFWKTQKKRHSSRSGTRTSWAISGSVGGRLLPIDPLFSLDEKNCFLATRTALLIYTTSNSQLHRKVDLSSHGHVSCLALGSDPHVFVGTLDGKIIRLDWKSGKLLDVRQAPGGVLSMSVAVSQSDPASAPVDVVDFTCNNVSAAEKGTGRVCRMVWQAAGDDIKDILQAPRALTEIQSLGNGKVLLVSSRERIYVGIQSGESSHHFANVEFSWYEVEPPSSIVSFHGQLPAPESTESSKASGTKGKGKAKAGLPTLDIAVGTSKGTIYVYGDLLRKLQGLDSQKRGPESDSSPSLGPRILHWHRSSVNTVKWSLDGNYLLSGGNETTLIIWQLRTGKRQELPHLTAAIDCLTVSPTGTSYALRLADNSLMVLSTSELEPIAHVSGIQCLTGFQLNGPQTSDNRTALDGQMQTSEVPYTAFNSAAALDPKSPHLLLLAVPASQPKSEPLDLARGKPFLQTFDLAASRSVSRQAMTRNFTTDPNVGPEGNKLVEPDVKLLQLSYDGKWLATVDEWAPSGPDPEYAALGSYDVAGGLRNLRLETYLKFWHWDEDKEVWVLEARIDSPHLFEDDVTPARVLNLEANPERHEFVTAGEDGFVRIWQAKTRLRDGVVVRGAKGEGMVAWTLKFAIELESPVEDVQEGFARKTCPIMSSLAYSQDGSMVAAAHEYAGLDDCGIVRLIDADYGTVIQSRADLFSSGLAGVAILNRHLVILSDSIVVWDLVDDVLEYGYDIDDVAEEERALSRHLAANVESNTFAVAIPATNRRSPYRVAVFDPTTSRPIFLSSKLESVTNLLAVPGSARYLVLNDRAELFTISHRGALIAPLIQDRIALGEAATPELVLELGRERDANGVEEMEMDDTGELNMTEGESAGKELIPSAEDEEEIMPGFEEVLRSDYERPELEFNNVSRQRRADLFAEYPSAALPSRQEMFRGIWDLYVPKAKKVRPLRRPAEAV